jgi:hypothetical protein
MRSPDEVFSALSKLYDFYREITKFKVKKKDDSAEGAAADPNASDRSTTAAGR